MLLHFLPFLLLIPTSPPGELLTLGQKVFSADLIVEVTLIVEGEVPPPGPGDKDGGAGRPFPRDLMERALRTVRVARGIVPRDGMGTTTMLSTPYVFAANSPCWWTARARGEIHVLLFYAQENGVTVRQLVGVEQETGQFTDLNPEYPLLVDAVRRARTWNDERAVAAAPAALWTAERTALRDTLNPYLPMLAVDFLRSHDAAFVIVDEWKDRASERETALAERYARRICTGF